MATLGSTCLDATNFGKTKRETKNPRKISAKNMRRSWEKAGRLFALFSFMRLQKVVEPSWMIGCFGRRRKRSAAICWLDIEHIDTQSGYERVCVWSGSPSWPSCMKRIRAETEIVDGFGLVGEMWIGGVCADVRKSSRYAT